MTYIGYCIDLQNRGTPIAIGDNYEEVMSQTIQRVLGIGAVEGSMQVQKREGLTAAEVVRIKDTLDAWFAEKGLQ